MENAVFRDGLLWGAGSAACKPPGDSTTRSCLQFLEVLTGGATPTLNQDFIFGTKKLYDYYPSVELDNFDDIVTSFTQSSSTEFPSAYVDGRLQTDPLNTLGTPVLIRRRSSQLQQSKSRDHNQRVPVGRLFGSWR